MKKFVIKITVIILHIIFLFWLFAKKSDDKTHVSGATRKPVVTKEEDNSKTEKPKETEEKYHHYIVKKGDNLSKIAQKYNTTVVAIMKENNLKSTNIHPGKQLVIKK